MTSPPRGEAPIDEALLDSVERLHAAVDTMVAPLAAAHAARLSCKRGCHACCVDELTVFAVEAAVIERHFSELLLGAEPHQAGACAFLDESGACRVYAHRPYVCRTQGLPLRWLEESREGEPTELRDICELNVDGGPPVESLSPTACWTLGPAERTLAELQSRVRGKESERVRLRALFRR